YVGGGLPLRPGADLFEAWRTRFGTLASRLGASSFEVSRLDATPQVQQTADRANAAGVSIYALALPESGAASADGSARTESDPEDAARALRPLAAGAGGAANPLRVELAVEEESAEKDGRLKVTAVASLPLAPLALQPQEHYHVAHLTLAVAARDGGGKISGVPHAEIPVEVPNERLLAAPGEAAGYRFTLHPAPGESVVAIAARDDSSGTESVL